ncbi:hypothetical protein BOX15_Mlig022662g5, partial [Macrostomum lignano]
AAAASAVKDDDEGFGDVHTGCLLDAGQMLAEAQELAGPRLDRDHADEHAMEVLLDRLKYTLDQFQEQPHMLDPVLDRLLGDCLARFKLGPDIPDTLLAGNAHCMHLVLKTRGYKSSARRMPHEASDLVLILDLLDRRSGKLTDHTLCCLLLWLSTVVLIPFDLARFDAAAESVGRAPEATVAGRIDSLAREFACRGGMQQEAACFLLARFYTRPGASLAEFAAWSIERLDSWPLESYADTYKHCGLLRSLGLLCKLGRREDLLPHAGPLLSCALRHCQRLARHTEGLLNKLRAKLIQRLGAIFLRQRLAAWRYKRGHRSLVANLAPNQPSAAAATDKDEEEQEELEDDFEVAPEVETVLDHLLGALSNRDSIVRWSAAKGIGRVAGRLPLGLADQVVDALLSKFNRLESYETWHGACLATAELSRRGLLLPDRLPAVLASVKESLVYDERSGESNHGSNVRDAACYVLWSFARAYHPVVLQPHVVSIATALVVTSLFDREINVRRAAAAAFQEHVGRQGNFPNGIEIVTNCDYFAVGNRSHAFTRLSLFVAGFGVTYLRPMLAHLVEHKLGHWDPALRELAAEAFGSLVPLDAEHCLGSHLPQLVASAQGLDLCLRHGAVLALAHSLYALGDAGLEASGKIEPSLADGVLNLISVLSNAGYMRGLAGELIRRACCTLVERLCRARPFPVPPEVRSVWQAFLDDCLRHREATVQEAAAEALMPFLDGEPVDVRLVEKYCTEALSASQESHRAGHCSALGQLPSSYYRHQSASGSSAEQAALLDRVLDCLADCSSCSSARTAVDTRTWAYARRAALRALVSACLSFASASASSPAAATDAEDKQLLGVFDRAARCLLAGLTDYTVDQRGDVGSLTREAALCGIADLVCLSGPRIANRVSPGLAEDLFCGLVQQAAEKIDRMRRVAGESLRRTVAALPERLAPAALRQMLAGLPAAEASGGDGDGAAASFNWANPSDAFPALAPLLGSVPNARFRYALLTGLVVSVGGLTESTERAASDALLTVVADCAQSEPGFPLEVLRLHARLLEERARQDRLTVPAMRSLTCLLRDAFISERLLLADEVDAQRLLDNVVTLVKAEVAGCTNWRKLLIAQDTLTAALQFPPPDRALKPLMLHLGHKYPVVRRNAASKLYEAVLLFDSVVPVETVDEVSSLLLETVWEEALEKVRPVRNRLCELLHLPVPTVKAGAAASAS